MLQKMRKGVSDGEQKHLWREMGNVSKVRQTLGMLFHIGVFFLKVSNTLVFVY